MIGIVVSFIIGAICGIVGGFFIYANNDKSVKKTIDKVKKK